MKLFHTIAEAEAFVKQNNKFAICELSPEQTKKSVVRTNGFCEIYFSMPENSCLSIGTQMMTAFAGDVFFVEPNVPHSFHVQKSGRPQTYYLLLVSPAFLVKFSSTKTNLEDIFLIEIPHHSRRVSLSGEQHTMLDSLLQKILTADGFGSDLIEITSFAEFLAIVGSLHIEQRDQNAHTLLRKGSLAYRLIRYIDTQITEPLQIADIASAFYISDSYVCRIFKQEYGITVNKYIQDRRLTIAKSLLEEGYSVTETCERSGFNDYTNFIKLFTRTVGTSPKRYSLYGI